MARDELSELRAFITVARESSFTRAAAVLGVSASALSHTIRGLEERLGLRLLARTTRSVATTEAGERLYRSIAPHFDEIRAEIDALSELRDTPSGRLRINSGEHAAETILRPALARFLPAFPDIQVEVSIDNGFVDIVGGHFDAGVRLGESLGKDMIAVRIGPDWRFVVVGAPDYLARRAPPEHPGELTNHLCVNLRLSSSGGLYAWEFEKDGRELEVRVSGQMTYDSIGPVLNAAVDGLGLAYVPEDLARPHLEAGRLRTVLEHWCPSVQGYHLYYPNRRLSSPAFTRLVEALRYRG
ncbi:LysR family transcriptional regulator [Thioclava pacifica]|uniref:LysR family transcriptional regulator n=1 Tax=Thioclava pacifica DSM 10166 TaxID=1353537 RepID=A0A074J8V8_9RHOB|nr:LysR family transcriptional regulator [Thioclava pacifica]KEO52018.1 LysR family transcriptional regulator [Thioclava pacifica DSM 10166]